MLASYETTCVGNLTVQEKVVLRSKAGLPCSAGLGQLTLPYLSATGILQALDGQQHAATKVYLCCYPSYFVFLSWEWKVLYCWLSLSLTYVCRQFGSPSKGIGPFTRRAELWNARAAMAGYALLAFLSYETGEYTVIGRLDCCKARVVKFLLSLAMFNHSW